MATTRSFLNRVRALSSKAYQLTQYNFTTHFGLVEMTGFGFGFALLGKTFFPNIWLKVQKLFQAKSNSAVSFEADEDGFGIPFNDQCQYAKNALSSMGLTTTFAPIVAICGHTSQTTNNAYHSALDCGACGGKSGQVNAQILAAILNKQNVRDQLYNEGIEIPPHVLFIAGLHNTTTQDIIFDTPKDMSSLHTSIVNSLKKDLTVARQKLVLPKNSNNHSHWAKVRPEWGLANNSAFIIGPRAVTENINLKGRAFLHSYDYKQDQDGKILESILTAPVVVAQWINHQYLFSTLNNKLFGSGNKITHNVTGKIGLTQGNGSDLLHGLPLQSLFSDHQKPYHTIQRLTVAIYAPFELIEKALNEHPDLKRLFTNHWLHMLWIDPATNKCSEPKLTD